MNLKPMFSRKIVFIFIAVLSTSIVVFALLGGANLNISTPIREQRPISSLTGAEGVDGPLLVVKIDDTTPAHPQVGLNSADVVYIEQVEGGLTRLAAVFSTDIPPLVGPVRSARISDIELFAQYGKVAFSYSGAQRKLLPYLAQANIFDVGANRYGPSYYFNEPTRNPPYALMLRAPELLTEVASRGSTPVEAKSMGWTFGDRPTGLIPVASVEVSWPAARYGLTWSTTEERWLLSHNGSPDLDVNGFNLGPQTFIIQIVSITDSEFKDKVGGVTPLSATVGEGKCYLMRDGGYLPCLWSRADQESGTTFTDPSGVDIPFDRGQIWFALTAKEPVFELAPLQGATKSSRK